MKSLETLQVRVGQDRLHKIPTKYYKISSTNRVDIEEILRVSVSLGHGVYGTFYNRFLNNVNNRLLFLLGGLRLGDIGLPNDHSIEPAVLDRLIYLLSR